MTTFPSSSTLVLDEHALTDRGQKRAHNEDTIWIARGTHPTHPDWSWSLYLVADGMGGMAEGKQASLLAAQCMIAMLHYQWPTLSSLENAALISLLRGSVEEANRAIHTRNQGAVARMGTTITAVLLVNRQAYIANVGDSRTYLARAQAPRLLPLTQDHSVVANLLATGQITEEEVFTHPQRHLITRYLGEDATVEVDLFHLALLPGDRLLLCSDGLWEMIPPKTLHSTLARRQPARETAHALVEEANMNGGPDNISAVIVDLKASHASSATFTV